MPTPRTCIVYARKSTDREDKQILSIPAQLDELRRFAERQGLIIRSELTEKCSAREPGRPVFSNLLQQAARGNIERILTWKLDRLARNPIDGGALIHYLGKGLLKELVTPEGTYTGTGDSKFMLSVQFGAATKMTDDLSAGVKRGNHAVRSRGRITGIPPLGYTKVRDHRGYRGAGKTVPDKKRFPIVKRVWQRVASGMPVADAWRHAVNEGLVSRPNARFGARVTSLQTIYDILRNPFYAGQIAHAGEVHKGEHEPMVSCADFQRVQAAITHATEASRPSTHRFLYAGILRCEACGRLCTGEQIKGRYIYYRCGRKRVDRAQCRQPAPSEQQVTDAIEATLAQLQFDDQLLQWSAEALAWWRASSNEEDGLRAAETERSLHELTLRLERLTDFAIEGRVSPEEYSNRKSLLLGEQERLERLREQSAEESAVWDTAVCDTLRRTSVALNSFREATPDGKQALIHEFFHNCTVRDRIVKPVLRFPFSALAEVRPNPDVVSGGDVNYPDPSKVLLNIRKNAHPRSRRERAFRAWWTRLHDVRKSSEQSRELFTILSGTNRRSSPCPGSVDNVSFNGIYDAQPVQSIHSIYGVCHRSAGRDVSQCCT